MAINSLPPSISPEPAGSRRRASPFLVGVLVVASSCGGAETLGDAPSGLEKSAASLVPELTIGGVRETRREYQFSTILDVVAQPDGTIWVLDGEDQMGETPLLRQYDTDGRFIRNVGGEGDGPGEYRWPFALGLMPDGRVALRDNANPNRITFYEQDGELDTTWSLDAMLSGVVRGTTITAVDTSGVMWLSWTGRPRVDRVRGIVRRGGFVRVSPNGAILDTVEYPDLPELPRQRIPYTVTRPGGNTQQRNLLLPYAPSYVRGWSPLGGFAVARTDEYRIEVLPFGAEVDPTDDARHPLAVFTRDVPRVAVSEAERTGIRADLLERASAALEEVSIPEIADRKPFIRSLKYSEDRRLWVLVYAPGHLEDGRWTEPKAYDVFAGDGRFLGRVTVPASFVMSFMRGDYVWGFSIGEMDVESIQRYRIVWP